MPNEVVVERDVMVTMRDGIQSACDVYRPARDGQPVTGAFPVILERTPYDQGAVSRSEMTAREPKKPKRCYWAQPGIYAAGAYEPFADVPQVPASRRGSARMRGSRRIRSMSVRRGHRMCYCP